MRLLVCGGRDYNDFGRLVSELNTYRDAALLIHGDARGADRLSGQWAAIHSVPVKAFPAEWGLHGKGAGHIRNQRMLDEGKPDLVIAFPGGTGTADMVRRAKAAGVRVVEIAA